MRRIFADTSFYQALLSPRDSWHAAALDLSNSYRGQVVTSEYVLCELGVPCWKIQGTRLESGRRFLEWQGKATGR